ncbi:hypothetical protein SRHO_G00256640 [Serrasalmus rhombeus]
MVPNAPRGLLLEIQRRLVDHLLVLLRAAVLYLLAHEDGQVTRRRKHITLYLWTVPCLIVRRFLSVRLHRFDSDQD